MQTALHPIPPAGAFPQHSRRQTHGLRAEFRPAHRNSGRCWLGNHQSFGNGISPCRQLLQFLRQCRKIPKKPKTDIIPGHRVNRLQEIPLQKAHDGIYFILRTFPVLGGKRIHRKILYAQILTICRNGTKYFRSHFMPGRARQRPPFGPAAVSVHNIAMWRGRWAISTNPAVCSDFDLKKAMTAYRCARQTDISSFCFSPGAYQSPCIFYPSDPACLSQYPSDRRP